MRHAYTMRDVCDDCGATGMEITNGDRKDDDCCGPGAREELAQMMYANALANGAGLAQTGRPRKPRL